MIIAGIGTSLPAHKIEQSVAFEITKTLTQTTPQSLRLTKAIYQNSGVATRHSVILDQSTGDMADRQAFFGDRQPTTLDRLQRYEAESVPMALESSRRALMQSGVAASDITHLVTVSCTGFFSPSFDQAIMKQLGMSPEVARTNVGFMGCHGLFNGMRVAKAFVDADPAAKVLICAVELCSLHQQYEWTADNMVANALFADGSAALVAVASPPAGMAMQNPYRLRSTGSFVFDETEFAMSWKITNHGFAMTLSAETPRLINEHLRPWLQAWLARQALTIDQVGSWAVHPGGPRILKAFAEAAGVPLAQLDASFHILNHYGNMSSPTVAFVMNHLHALEMPRPCVAIGFGPGLATEAALFD